jgi:hypothetical protein
MPDGRLLTAGCTTGWLDWIHSELWLFDDGLLLVRTDFARTLANGFGPTVTSTPLIRRFETGDLDALRSSQANSWITPSSLLTATFEANPLAHGVNLVSAGGTRKLLWLASDQPEAFLREAFGR